ncbi:hypothetical protein Lac2_09540 [Claveliimonas bilis]|nr:hypothetical protein Lac2_09540 [Claveliimonas bilis]
MLFSENFGKIENNNTEERNQRMLFRVPVRYKVKTTRQKAAENTKEFQNGREGGILCLKQSVI